MKAALITGACINTGVDIVEKFASEGWNVIFTGRREAAVKEKEKEYSEKFPEVSIKGFVMPYLVSPPRSFLLFA